MKYCLFESGDVVGPLTAEEILLRLGFGPNTFVCPEEHSEDEAYWKEAFEYADFGFKPESSAAEELSSAESSPCKDPTSVSSFPAENKTDLSSSGLETSSAPSPEKEEAPSSVERPISSILLDATEEKSRKEMSPTEKSVFSAPERTVSPGATEDTKAEDLAVDFQTVSGAKPSPIEEYFNTIRSGDLGNILGIPDAKENSDMSLSRAMRNQFEKTEPPSSRSSSEEELKDPFDTFSPAPDAPSQTLLESEGQVFPSQPSKKTEKDGSETSAAPDAAATPETLAQSMEEKETPAEADISVVPAPDADEAKEEKSLPSDDQKIHSSGNFPAYSAPTEPKAPDTVTTILDGKLDVQKEEPDILEPIKAVEPQEKILKESDASKENAVSAAPVFVSEEQKHGKKKLLFLIFGVFILLAGVLLRLYSAQPASHPQVPSRPAETLSHPEPKPVAERVRPVPSVSPVAAVQAPAEPVDPLELSKQVAQQHQLGKGRGTVEEYLNKRYAAELAAGYSSAWSSEPLHRNVYVVKYRLAKARKEPIVYIFQTDVSKKKLTGALNNITLDLVGKIRD